MTKILGGAYPGFAQSSVWTRAALSLLAGAAILAGIYGRFKGLGAWPLGVDEFYILRSVDNVMKSGLPRFDCGGYYNRGVLYQYAVAGIRLLGAGPELAGRWVAAASSLAVLPAAWLLARRCGGWLAGWLTLIILSVSIWEIEMGRFARMYAPFQAVFTAYLLMYLRYTVDRKRAALGWMALLSVIGVITWEGGVLLGVANLWAVLLTHEQGRFKAAHLIRLSALGVLLMILYWIGTNDFRGAGAETGDAGGHADGPARRLAQLTLDGFAPLLRHHFWMGGWVMLVAVIATLACVLLRRTGCPPGRRWAAAGLCAALVMAAAHLFVAAAGLYLLLLLSGLIEPPRRSGYFLPAAAALLIFWLAFDAWVGTSDRILVDFPDVFQAVIRPWGRTMPLWSAALALPILFEFVRSLSRPPTARDPSAVLLSLVILLVLVVAATRTERIETRYTFFLYPLLVVLAVSGWLALTDWVLRRVPIAVFRRAPIALGAAIPLTCFGATEDFQPGYLAHVDRADVNFRVGMSASLAAHYYPRSDVGGTAEWLAKHTQPGDIVITGIPNLDPYFRRVDYFYIDGEDGRYDAYVCRDGRTERWTNHPLLHSDAQLSPILDSGRRILAVVYPDTERRLRAAARARGWSVTSAWQTRYGDADVLLIESPAGARP